jgi:hypothetical protein
MNFEFKSTFKHTALTNALILRGIRSVYLSIRNNFVTLLAFNISAFCLFYYLYSENYFIPAVYGSKPSGESWINLFQTLGFAWTLSTAFAFSELVFQITKKYRLVQRLNALTNPVVARITSAIRLTMMLLILLVTMLIQISNYTYTLCFRD